MQTKIRKHLDIYARIPGRDLCKPLLAFGSDITVVREFEILKTHADGETEMPAFQVGIWTVHDLVIGPRV